MDNKEKAQRCENTETRVLDDIGNIIACKVYTRWIIENCNDCSFSTHKGDE